MASAGSEIGCDDRLLLAYVPRAQLVDPDRLHDAEHPAVEAGAFLELMLPRERPLARRCGCTTLLAILPLGISSTPACGING